MDGWKGGDEEKLLPIRSSLISRFRVSFSLEGRYPVKKGMSECDDLYVPLRARKLTSRVSSCRRYDTMTNVCVCNS